MPNPYLPAWEYIPDGEPRVFGERVYIYGSHDRPALEHFCDYKLKVWSAPVTDLSRWQCHGHAFHTRADNGHASSVDHTDRELYAPDVVERGGKYYLYAYIVGSKGVVAVSSRPEGPFEPLSAYVVPDEDVEDLRQGVFIDPGILVDGDGSVYIYCGYLYSYMARLNPDNMFEVLPGSYKRDIIPADEPFCFFEACSPRKVGDTYYLIYSPKRSPCLAYATSKSPEGPFDYRGVIIDNGVDYPGGNNHGSICQINGQWYIFYHRMTNNTIMSRRACVERIELLPDGSIPQVEMTSLGFDESLSPYQPTPAELACVLKGGCYITELNIFERRVSHITPGCVVGYKYFDFGQDCSATSVSLFLKLIGCGERGIVRVLLDAEDGQELGRGTITPAGGVLKITLPCLIGRHAVYFAFESGREGWFADRFDGRELCQMEGFVFCK
jgi:hypothetical protein